LKFKFPFKNASVVFYIKFQSTYFALPVMVAVMASLLPYVCLPTILITTYILQHTHGGPDDTVRHAGDFGNILADENGNSVHQINGTQISLYPADVGYSVGRAFVVHAGKDDLGKGQNEESLLTGNAGARLACCIVESLE
jgi:hypothetical protein